MFLHFGSSLKTLLRALEVGPGSQPPFQKWWFLLDDVANPYLKIAELTNQHIKIWW